MFIDLHMHEMRYSKDSFLKLEEMIVIAKEKGLDAIHDTVHEMARDEARHGKAFEGFLKRYFNS